MLKKIALLLPLTLFALPAAASDGHLDVFYVPSAQIKGSGGSESGTGYGAHVVLPIGSTFLAAAEYQRNSYDAKLQQFRAGGGVQSSPDRARLMAYGEYVRLKPDDSSAADGFGVHARVTYTVMEPLNLFAEAGYVRLDGDGATFDGPEFLFGAAWSFTQQFGVFADYRISRFDANGDAKIRFYDVRTGLRIYLGG